MLHVLKGLPEVCAVRVVLFDFESPAGNVAVVELASEEKALITYNVHLFSICSPYF